jgi:hypothetical protein
LSYPYIRPSWRIRNDGGPIIKNYSFGKLQEKRRNLNGYLDERASADFTFLKGGTFPGETVMGQGRLVDYSKLLDIFEEEFD